MFYIILDYILPYSNFLESTDVFRLFVFGPSTAQHGFEGAGGARPRGGPRTQGGTSSSLSISLDVSSVSLRLFTCLSFSLVLAFFVSRCLSDSVCLSLSVSVCLPACRSVSLSLSLFLSLSLSLYFSLSLFISLSLSLSLFLSLCSLPISLSLSLSVYLYEYSFMCIWLCMYAGRERAGEQSCFEDTPFGCSSAVAPCIPGYPSC